jgi:hypothetical protein
MSKDIYTKVIEELMDKFFVKVEYNNTENKIVGLRPFKTGSILDKYSNLNGIL